MSPRKKTAQRDNTIPEMAKQTKVIVACKNDEQKQMMKTVAENVITFIKGSPGSGKTFLAVAFALQQLFRSKFRNIVFTRPVVEAGGEKLGFLPGDIHEKIDPYMIPIYTSLIKLVDEDLINKLMTKNGKAAIINILPLAYMRGCTFDSSIIICDEMQNSTPEQVRMLITRIGENSKMVICGDVRQSDIHQKNGLEDAFDLLQGVGDVGFATLSEESIVRHPIIREIELRYKDRESQKENTTSKRNRTKS